MKHPVNKLKKALRQKKFQLGVWSGLCSPIAAEVLSGTPFDWMTIDMEHSPNTLDTVLHQLQATQGNTMPIIVRPPWNDFVIIKQLLDIGAQSFIIPYVQTREEAEQAVAATRYPPEGIRGVAGGNRAGLYGEVPDYLVNAGKEICVIVQVETASAVDRIEEIASVKGVDGIFVGPSDLAASMGHLGNYNHPDVQAKIAEAAKRILATGKAAATLSFNADQARTYAGMGYHMIATASDVTLLRQGAAALVDGFESLR